MMRTIEIGESETDSKINLESFTESFHKVRVVDGEDCDVITGVIAHLGPCDVKLNVHTGTFTRAVQLSVGYDWREERISSVVGPIREENT